jgi:hypothetical protein
MLACYPVITMITFQWFRVLPLYGLRCRFKSLYNRALFRFFILLIHMKPANQIMLYKEFQTQR